MTWRSRIFDHRHRRRPVAGGTVVNQRRDHNASIPRCCTNMLTIGAVLAFASGHPPVGAHDLITVENGDLTGGDPHPQHRAGQPVRDRVMPPVKADVVVALGFE